MSQLAQDFAFFLYLKGYGDLGSSIFYGKFLPYPDNGIFVMDDSGDANIESVVREGRVMIFVRNTSYNTSAEIASGVQSDVAGVENLFAGNSGLVSNVGFSYAKRLPMYEGEDPRKRHVWSVECFVLYK